MIGMPTVLITGASRGIGRACALRFSREGYDVIVNYSESGEKAESLVGGIVKTGRRAVAIRADVSVKSEVESLFEEAGEHFDGLDCLVINAGIYVRSSFRDQRDEDWERMMRVNLDGAYHCVKCALPLMEGREGATMVFVSSQLALRGSAHGASYSASKSAMHGLMKSLALELAPGIRVNALAPGEIDTDLLGADTPEKRAEREARILLGRLGTPEEMASAVWFLGSSESSFMTGAVLHCNGGVLMP
jgi:3-oxoacyl-[acyl-carrier protein] reductase